MVVSPLTCLKAVFVRGLEGPSEIAEAWQVAAMKGQLGTVRIEQRRYPEALAPHEETCEGFTRLDEPGSLAVSWHEIGRVYQKAGQPEAAEDAYRKALEMEVRLGSATGQSNAKRSSAKWLSRGRLGASSPTSRQTQETSPTLRRRSARPSHATWPTGAMGARTTTLRAAFALP
jgi:tetratricopeptide (TPR) repeat protein